MNRIHAPYRYVTEQVTDNIEGFLALDLFAISNDGTTERVARLTFWDASGQWALEMFGSEVPLKIVEELIAEAKIAVPNT